MSKFASALDELLYTYCAGDNDWHTTGSDGYHRALTSLHVGPGNIDTGALRKGIVSCLTMGGTDDEGIRLITALAELRDWQLEGHWLIEEDNDGFVSATSLPNETQVQIILEAFDTQWGEHTDGDDDDDPHAARAAEEEILREQEWERFRTA